MKNLAMLMACVAIAAAGAAQVQAQAETPASMQGWTHKADLSSILCKQLPGMSKPQVEELVTWLQGFYTLEKAPRVIDPDKIKADITKLETYCKQNPQANLVAAADDVMGEQ